jgi:hypothetical protein
MCANWTMMAFLRGWFWRTKVRLSRAFSCSRVDPLTFQRRKFNLISVQNSLMVYGIYSQIIEGLLTGPRTAVGT